MSERDDVRVIWTTIAIVVTAGLAAVLGLTFLQTGCTATSCDLEGLFMTGIVAAWGAPAMVAIGRYVWTRDVAHGFSTALLLGWFALHFAAPAGFWVLYMEPLMHFTGAMDMVGFLIYWALAGAVAVAAVWFVPLPIQRFLQPAK